jgi:hypothetical protein
MRSPFVLFIASCLLLFQNFVVCEQSSLDPTHYLLPQNHHIKATLNRIFSDPTVLDNDKNFCAAGFITLYRRPFDKAHNILARAKFHPISSKTHSALFRVAKHPALKGYLFKLYIEDEVGSMWQKGQERLILRCRGANQIRNSIQRHKIRRFTVAKKWLHMLPEHPVKKRKTFVLVAKDMKVCSSKISKNKWKTKITKRHLLELFQILNKGYASLYLVKNIPYTKYGTFSCIDTEYPPRKFPLEKAKRFFSEKMQKYWAKLIKKNEQQKIVEENVGNSEPVQLIMPPSMETHLTDSTLEHLPLL